MRRNEDGWIAACGDGEQRSASLREAIRDAVGHARGEALRLHADSYDSIEQWVAEQAERIERESGRT